MGLELWVRMSNNDYVTNRVSMEIGKIVGSVDYAPPLQLLNVAPELCLFRRSAEFD